MATYATMGYIGFVKLGNFVVRATSCDIKTSQEITYPEVVDGRTDTTIYQMGPKITGGSVAFPLVHENTGANQCVGESGSINTSNSLVAALWKLAAFRDQTGRLTPFDSFVRYTDSLSYKYPTCYLNSLTFTIAQSDAIQVSAEVFGGASSNNGTQDRIKNIGDVDLNYLSPARVATWNDALVQLFNINGSQSVFGRELREFSVTINNNMERFYTLNGLLSAFDVAPKKREVSGTLKIIGHNQNLTDYAQSNETRNTSDAAIAFGFKLGGGTPYWATSLHGVIFEIEEVALSTGLFETSTKWRATGKCGEDYDATSLGTNTALSASMGGGRTTQLPNYSG